MEFVSQFLHIYLSHLFFLHICLCRVNVVLLEILALSVLLVLLAPMVLLVLLEKLAIVVNLYVTDICFCRNQGASK